MTTPDDGEVAGLVDSLECEARNEEIYGNCAVITATELRRAATLLQQLSAPPDGEVAELVRRLRDWRTVPLLQDRVRAADLLSRLAPQPVPEGPSDEELVQLAFREKLGRLDSNGNIITRYYYPMDIGENVIALARAVLARWGTPNLAQVRSSLGAPHD
jgi:hypothetical protein